MKKNIILVFYNLLVFIVLLIITLFLGEGYFRLKSDTPFALQSNKNILGHNLFKTSFGFQFDSELGFIPLEYYNHPEHPNFGMKQKSSILHGIRLNVLLPSNYILSPGNEYEKQINGILCVGDSFTEGLEVGNNESWPAHLEMILQRKVINAGVSVYGLDQAILRAESLLKKYNFELVIIAFIPDDVERMELSMRSGAYKPYFSIKEEHLILHNNHVVQPIHLTEIERNKYKTLYNKISFSFIAVELFQIYIQTSDRLLLNFGGRKKVNHYGGKIGTLLIDKLLEMEKKFNTKIILMAQYEDYQFDKSKTINENWRIEYLEKSKMILSEAKKKGLKVIDLYEPLQSNFEKDPVEFRSLYIGPERHMTSTGNKFLAENIAKQIKK